MSDSVELARQAVRDVLATYFVGSDMEEDLEVAASDVVKSIQHLLSVQSQPKNKLGATVMTESASMRSGKDGLPGIPPRRL